MNTLRNNYIILSKLKIERNQFSAQQNMNGDSSERKENYVYIALDAIV